MKLSEAMADYWLAKELTMAETTMPGYRRTFHRFVDYLEDIEIAAVTSADVRRFLLHLRNDLRLGKRTVSDAWVPLSSLWTWAESELGLPHILRGKVARPAFTKKMIEPLTQEDMRRLLAVVWTDAQGAERKTGYRDRALILTLLDSGARVSELCAFTVGDYDATNGRLHIRHGKGDKARFVVVGTRTQKAIAKWLESWGGAQNHAPLFPSKATGGALRRDAVKHLLARLARRAGVANVHPHRFRHTFAINFLRNGGSVLMLQALLGHTDLSMSKRYVALAELDIDGARKQSPVDGWKL